MQSEASKLPVLRTTIMGKSNFDAAVVDGLIGADVGQSRYIATRAGLIPNPIDQNSCAQSRNPMDMIFQG